MRDLREIVVLGAGSALELYAAQLRSAGGPVLVCDLVSERAAAAARAYGFRLIAADLAGLPARATVLNLTPPGAHGATNTSLLDSGHPVFSEKPAAHNAADLARIVAQVARGARLAVAPDTHLSPAASKAGELIRSGVLGSLVAVRGSYRTPGHERWHPRPFVFYGPGGGVCLDIAPYFLRSTEALFGPLTLRHVRRTLGARPDLAMVGTEVISVPLRSSIDLETCTGHSVRLELAFDAKDQRSTLRIRLSECDLTFDPVSGGSALTLTHRRTGARETLVPEGEDTRGAGLACFLAADSSDPYFGKLNVDSLAREQQLLLALDQGGPP